MANQSVLELAVGTGKWDAGLKKAVTSLNNFTQASGGVQKALEQDSQKMTSFVQMMGRMESTAKSAKGRMNEYKNAITELTTQYRGLTEEEKRSSFGQALTQSIQQLTEKAGQARDAIADVNAAISHAASDTRVFDQISAGATFVTSSFQTLQGAAKLVGIEMGDNVQVIAKLQAAMAVTNGLTTIQNALQKQSALIQGVMAVQLKARAAAEALATTGTKAATVAQAAFNAVANANPYVLLATAVVGVATAMIAFGGNTDEATEAEKRQQEATEKLKQEHKEFAENLSQKLGQTVGDTISKFQELQEEWGRLQTRAEQDQWIKKNQSAFNGLGLSVRDVNAAYKVFVEQAPQVIAALRAIAEEKALQEVLHEERKKLIQMQYEEPDATNGGAYIPAVKDEEISRQDAQRYGFLKKKNPTDKGTFYVYAGSGGKLYLTAAGAKEVNEWRSNEAAGLRGNRLVNQQHRIHSIEAAHDRKLNESMQLQANLPWFQGGGGLGNYRGSGRGSGGSGGNGGNNTPPKVEPPKGSMKYYEQELANLRELQSLVTTKNDWQHYAGQIEVVTKAMKELRGETEEVAKVEEAIGLSGPSKGAMGDWMSYQNEQLDKAIIGSADYNAIAANILDTQMLQSLMEETAKNGIDLTEASEAIFEQLLNGENIPDETWQSLVDVINEKLEEAGIDPLALDFGSGSVGRGEKKESSFDKTMGKVSEGLNALSSISGGLQQMGIKVPEEVDKVISFGQGLLQVIEGVESIISLFQVSSTNANTVALAANTIAIGGLTTALIANTAISAIPFFSHGGLVRAALGTRVPGNHYSGDQVPALLNSGEVVLNQAQAGVVANKLQNGTPTIQIEGIISGENIRLVQRNNNLRTGRGEYVTTKRR